MSKSLGDFKIPKKARVQSVVIVPKASRRETAQNKARDFSSKSHRRSTKFILSQSWARSKHPRDALEQHSSPKPKVPRSQANKNSEGAQEKGNAISSTASPPIPLYLYLNIPVTSIPFWQPRLVANTGTQTMEPTRNCKRCSHIFSAKDKGSQTDNSLLANYPAIKKKTQVRGCHLCQGKH